MVLNSIEKLLEKYDNGETTLKEEQRIKDYFAQDNVPEHLESYRLMFQYFNNTKQELYTKDVPLKPRKSYIYQWISVAAVAVLMLGIMVPNLFGNDVVTPETVYTQDQLEAYNQTKNALSLLSNSFNESASNVNTLGLVSTNFNKGAENVNRVSEFAKTTNKLVKRKNTQKH
ncbi:hypothetical protein [Psychroserpens sp.]|uniref:hypothetical protein n=1 Tax=Psychroserpens sp. TaxID=2020870 RepID=UPI001B00F2D4|nr:hypothetical protein [Psychroserpens sp.]MBO6607070.1 hypothetical protein [Psychroserpens sp.]MBO6654216.1 hypothetical protein [Psychroserpens sp.]MBO6682498.1 hypothetical protein [Psychroserpens sp.]MBO6750842.1 hypothetical protein [Psychroserpens sp.]MBO6915729.1 hypothetical protein [Psychroserpens sp.]